MLREFTLENLEHLDDGRVLEAWKQAVSRATADCEDRPGVAKARVVKLELSLVPAISEGGRLDTCKGSFTVKDSVPTRQSAVYDLAPRKISGHPGRNHQLVFNDLSDDNVSQMTLDEGER